MKVELITGSVELQCSQKNMKNEALYFSSNSISRQIEPYIYFTQPKGGIDFFFLWEFLQSLVNCRTKLNKLLNGKTLKLTTMIDTIIQCKISRIYHACLIMQSNISFLPPPLRARSLNYMARFQLYNVAWKPLITCLMLLSSWELK